jgi:hypothetical protein
MKDSFNNTMKSSNHLLTRSAGAAPPDPATSRDQLCTPRGDLWHASGKSHALPIRDHGHPPRNQRQRPSVNPPRKPCKWTAPFSVCFALISLAAFRSNATSAAFEGRIRAVGGRSGATTELSYTVTTNLLRVEMTDTNFPNPVDILDLGSGQVTVLFPINRTFVRFKPASPNSSRVPPGFPGRSGALPPGIGPTNSPGMPAMPIPPTGLPLGVGPQTQVVTVPGRLATPNMPGPSTTPGMGSRSPIPMMPPAGGLELQATSAKTNLLNFECQRFEIRQFGQTMEIWATEQLVPFQAYLPHQPPGFGPPMIEDQWSGLLSAKKLFPLRAVLTADNGVERYRFEVQSITPAHLSKEEAQGFQPPEGYVQIRARSF